MLRTVILARLSEGSLDVHLWWDGRVRVQVVKPRGMPMEVSVH